MTRQEMKIYLKVLQDESMWNKELIKAVKNGLNVETEIKRIEELLK